MIPGAIGGRNIAYLRRGQRADQPHYIMAAMRSGGGLAERGNDAIDHLLDQDAIVALAHHADHGLGAGRADQQTAVAIEPFLADG